MPTYDFRCPQGHKFSYFYKTMSTALSQLPCPECGAVADRQLSAGAGFAFKGSGFYLTDYGKNAHRGTALEAQPSASGEKGESKPAGDSGAKSDTGAKADAATQSESKRDGAKSESKKADSSSAPPVKSKATSKPSSE